MPKQLQWGFSGIEDVPDATSNAAAHPTVSATTDAASTAGAKDEHGTPNRSVSGQAPSGHSSPSSTAPETNTEAVRSADVAPPVPTGRSGLMTVAERSTAAARKPTGRSFMAAQVASVVATSRVSGTNSPLGDETSGRVRSASRPPARGSVAPYGSAGSRNQGLDEPTIPSMPVPSVSPDVLAKQARHNAQLEQEHQVSSATALAIRKAALKDVLEAILGVSGPQLDNYQLDMQAVVSAVNGKITRSIQETEATLEAKIGKKLKAQQEKMAQEEKQKSGRAAEEAKRKMDERMKQLMADTKRLTSQVDALEKEKSSIHGKAAQASREIKEKEEQINALKAALAESEGKAERQAKQIAKMEQTITKVRNEGIQQQADLGARLRTTQTALDTALKQLEESRNETANTQRRGIEALQSQREALETQAANNLAEALEESKQQHEAHFKEHFDAIEETMQRLLDSGRTAEQTLEQALEAGYALGRDLEYSMAQLDDEQKMLKGELVKGMHALLMDAKNFGAEMKGLAEETKEHTNMALRVHKRLDELGPDGVNALMTELDDTKSFLKQARQEAHDLEAHLSQETKRSKRLSDEKNAMIQELRRQESMCKDLRDNIAALRQMHEGLNQQLTAAKKEVIDTQNKVQSKQKEVTDLHVVVQERDKQLTAVQRAFANSQEQIKKLNETIESLQQQQARMMNESVWSAASMISSQISGLHKRYFHGSPPLTKGQGGSPSTIIQANTMCRLNGEEITAASHDFIERNRLVHSKFRPALAESKAAIAWMPDGLQEEEEDDEEQEAKSASDIWKQEVESNLLVLEGALLNVLMDLRAKERELEEVATAVQGVLEEGPIEKKPPQNKSWPQKRPDSSGHGSTDLPTVSSLTAQMVKAMASERREMQRMLKGGSNNVEALNSRSHSPTPMMYRHFHHETTTSGYRHSDTNILYLSGRTGSPQATSPVKGQHTSSLHSTSPNPSRVSSPVIGSTTNTATPPSSSRKASTPPRANKSRNRAASPTNSSSGSPREADLVKPASPGQTADSAPGKDASSHVTISTSVDGWIASPSQNTDTLVAQPAPRSLVHLSPSSAPTAPRASIHSSPSSAPTAPRASAQSSPSSAPTPSKTLHVELSGDLEAASRSSSVSDKAGHIHTYVRQAQGLKSDSAVGQPAGHGYQDLQDTLPGSVGKDKGERLAWLDGGSAAKRHSSSQIGSARLSQSVTGYHQWLSTGPLSAEPQHDMSEVLAVLNLLEEGTFSRDSDSKALRPWSAMQADHHNVPHSHAKLPHSAHHPPSATPHHNKRTSHPTEYTARRSWEAPLEALSTQIEQRQAASTMRSHSPDASFTGAGWHSRKPQRIIEEGADASGTGGSLSRMDLIAMAAASDDKSMSPYLQQVSMQFRTRKVHPLTKTSGRDFKGSDTASAHANTGSSR